MVRWEKYFRVALLICSLGIVTRVLFLSLMDEHARMPQAGEYGLVSFLGEYSVDGAAFQPFEGRPAVDDAQVHTVVLRGHFSRDILPNQVLLMRLEYLAVRLAVNGTEKFSYGTRETIPQFMQTGGNVLSSYVSEGIYTSDLVEITLHNAHALEVQSMYDTFFNQLYVGSERDFYMEFFSAWIFPFMLAFFVTGMGIFAFFVGIGLWKINKNLGQKVLLYAGMTISVGLWSISDYQFMSMVSRYTFFNEFAATLCSMTAMLFFIFYIRTFLIAKKGKRIMLFSADLCLLLYLFIFIRQIAGGEDTYVYSPHIFIFVIIMMLTGSACLLYEVIVMCNVEAKLILYTYIFVLIGILVDFIRILIEDTYFLQRFFFIAEGVLFFIFAQIVNIVYAVYCHNQRLCRMRAMEQEVMESRIAVMQSQIQPHFLYNALTSIRGLCTINPCLAKEAITNFSHYLRGNLDSLDQREPISFVQELAHVKHYLAIEKMRFGDKIDIVWDIKTVDFALPALTLQPMVENAVRHGMAVAKEPHRVVISTEVMKNGIMLCVADNGSGFSANELQKESFGHIGIKNTVGRIEKMCGGSLSIESKEGSGTMVKIFLPEWKTGRNRE